MPADHTQLMEASFSRTTFIAPQLELNGAVEVVKEITPTLEDSRFIFILIELIVDILELDSLGEVAGFHTAYAIGEHPLKRDAVLR